MKCSPWGAAETFWLCLSSPTKRGRAGSTEQLFPLWPRDRADDPRHVFISLLLALGSANQAHCHTTATGAALKPDWRKSSFCRRSTQLQGKNYCGKPFRTSQGVRNLCQSLGMHSKHPQPAVRIEFFTLKSLGHWKSVRFFPLPIKQWYLK